MITKSQRFDLLMLMYDVIRQETVTKLLTNMFDSAEPVESSIVSGLQVIQTLLEFRKSTP